MGLVGPTKSLHFIFITIESHRRFLGRGTGGLRFLDHLAVVWRLNCRGQEWTLEHHLGGHCQGSKDGEWWPSQERESGRRGEEVGV